MMVADENFECLQSGLPASSCPALWRAMLLLSKINQIVLLLYAIRGPPLHKIMLPPRDFFVLAMYYLGLRYIIGVWPLDESSAL
jgi:hypothetical protein